LIHLSISIISYKLKDRRHMYFYKGEKKFHWSKKEKKFLKPVTEAYA